MKKIFTLLFVVLITANINAQKNEPAGPTLMSSSTSMTHVTSIASRPNDQIPIDMTPKEAKDRRSLGNEVIIGKDPQTKNDLLASNPNPLTQKIAGKAPSIVFDAYVSGATPTDPSLAIGPNHVFVVFNTGFRIFDKSGNPLTEEISPDPAIFPSSGCCDLTVSYDAAADRWVLSFLTGAGAGAQIAVSDGPDPVNDGWFVYNIPAINDYQKLSIWSDGYYLTDNNNDTNKIFAMERNEMLLGNPAAQVIGFPLPGIITSGFFSPQAFNVSNANMPAVGGAPFVYLQDDAWSGVSQDHIKLWTVDVDWVTPESSTISAAQTINTTPFISVFDGGSFSNLEEPDGVNIDALQATIMNQAQFRKFGSYNAAIFNFVVDTDASEGELAGIRWYEFRQDGDNMPWSLFQEGTYTAPDGRHAWHASMIMDVQGNIGMGYTSMSGPTTPTTVRVSSYYTGRFANDPLGTMTISEELIENGTEDIGSFRYGDYSKIDVDPVDDKTFWFINEYRKDGRKGVVGVFKIAPNTTNDTGVISIDSPTNSTLGANEDVIVTVFNYGEDSQTNIPIELSVDGNVVATGVLTDLTSLNTAQFTFTGIDLSIVNHTYTLTSCTGLTGDEDTENDCTTSNVTNLNPTDIGITAITAPTGGESLGSESITVTIENFGGADQSNFDVSYTLNSETPVVETVAGPLAVGSTIPYTFTAQGDFSVVASHTLMATTQLTDDADTSNDAITETIVNLSCLSEANTTSQPVGPDGGTITTSTVTFIEDFVINDINVTLDITHTWVADLDIKLVAPNGTEVILAEDQGGGNANFTNTIFDDEATILITEGSAPFTGSFQPEGSLATLNGLQSIGDWNLVIEDDTNFDGGNLNSWSLQLCSDDVTASVEGALFNESDFRVATLENNQFIISVNTTEITDRLNFSVTNMLGQKLLSYNLDNENGGYKYSLDMSYATPGVYILRLGNSKYGNTKKIVVK
ncbi:MAG: proprotein convertase P-domain-containing protein [Flavobacteriaceae bacterium]|nr:proprotein convertase P-domain-containing protein [Flavobacteriaceae bacterium]